MTPPKIFIINDDRAGVESLAEAFGNYVVEVVHYVYCAMEQLYTCNR